MADIDITEHVRLLLAESERRMREYIDDRFSAVDERIQRVADATAAALAPHVGEAESAEEIAEESAEESAEEVAEEVAEESAEEVAEEVGAIVATDDGQLLEEVPGIVEELTPAEALDEIEPLRTHPLLRPVRWPWGNR